MARKPPLYPHVPKSRRTLGGQVTPGFGIFPYERDIREARELAEQAAETLEKAKNMDDIDSALWRLVDAAGLTARYANITAVGRPNSPTGRGYFIDST